MARRGFIQTRLERFTADGRKEIVSFIPAKLATPGLVVDLKEFSCRPAYRFERDGFQG